MEIQEKIKYLESAEKAFRKANRKARLIKLKEKNMNTPYINTDFKIAVILWVILTILSLSLIAGETKVILQLVLIISESFFLGRYSMHFRKKLIEFKMLLKTEKP